jgi:hypothetical protein
MTTGAWALAEKYKGIPRALFLLAFLFVGVGCGAKDDRKPAFPVKGSVMVGGKPAVNAQVVFHPLNDSDPQAIHPNGEVGADGTFTLNCYTTGDGAPAGEYAVTVRWPEGSSTIGGDADTGGDRLGERYSNPKTTPLRATVSVGPTELKPFQLK